MLAHTPTALDGFSLKRQLNYNDVKKEEMLFISARIKAFNYACIFSSLAAY